ncbi:MAG: purine-binding chemotaxis protein CheW [Candidatus Eremiobacteraeota bacterium]|nr:purine-binding chemotaxis protein CheW [Candidatus Eremiobacteraeota bacterium]
MTRALIVFVLDEREFGIEIAHVRGIERPVRITRVPRSRGKLEGIINLRGQLLPIVDLRTRLGLGRVAATKASCIVVVERAGSRVGIVVDAVSEVMRVAPERIQRAGGTIEAGGRTIELLDVAEVFAPALAKDRT